MNSPDLCSFLIVASHLRSLVEENVSVMPISRTSFAWPVWRPHRGSLTRRTRRYLKDVSVRACGRTVVLTFFNLIFLFVYILVCTFRYPSSFYRRFPASWIRSEDLIIVGTFTIRVNIVDLLALSLRECQRYYAILSISASLFLMACRHHLRILLPGSASRQLR